MKKILFCLILSFLIIIPTLSALSKDPVIQYVEQGNNLFNLGQYEEAIALFDTAIKMNANAADAFMGKGNCYTMMNNNLQAEKMYEKAMLIDPTLKAPDLSFRKNMQKLRGVNADKIRAKYYALIGKKDGVDTSAVSPEAVPEAITAKATEQTKEEIKQAQDEHEMWSRGGRARTSALGGIELVAPDLSTAMDGAAHGIEAGLLFRRDKHFFNFQPFAGKYARTVKYPGGSETYDENFAADITDSMGEIGWPNKNFLNSIRPLYSNSYMLRTTAGPDSRESNTGNLFGGEYIAGFKPIPLFGIAGMIGYEYAPYQETTPSQNAVVTSTKLKWNVSSGIFLPYLFHQTDELDITAAVGTYSPKLKLSDIGSGSLLGLPYTMKDGVTRQYTITTPLLLSDPYVSLLMGLLGYATADGVKREDSVNIESTGYDVKGNVHYMLGNGLHEVFVYINAPSKIEYKMNSTTKYTANISGAPVPLTETSSPKVSIGSERGFAVETGARSNIRYVMPALKYGYKYTESYMKIAIPGIPYTGRSTVRQHNIVTGLNITPVDAFAMPVEYEYNYAVQESTGVLNTSVTNEVRGGFEVKPAPVIVLRGGMSYSLTRNDGTGIAPSGSAGNPFINSLGYHLGGGFDMPLFELNAGAVYKRIYESPSPVGSSVENSYFMFGFIDLNIYI